MEEAQIKYNDTIESEECLGKPKQRKLLKRHVNILKEERGDPEMLLKLAKKNMQRSKISLPKTEQIGINKKTSVEM